MPLIPPAKAEDDAELEKPDEEPAAPAPAHPPPRAVVGSDLLNLTAALASDGKESGWLLTDGFWPV
jgi:hypothetical protein